MAIELNTVTDPELPEPKGIAAATSSEVYVADGVGSGGWEFANPHGGIYYSDIGTGTTLTAPTAYTKVAVSTTSTHLRDFTSDGAGRLTYTGAANRHVHMVADIVFKHSTGSGQDVFFTVFHNGVEEAGADMVQTADSANYQKISMHWDEELVTNDYFEIFAKTASGNIIIHKMYMFMMGMPG